MKRYEKCILATVPIAWDENFSFVERKFRNQTRFILQHGTRNIYIFGTAGEGYAVSDNQFKQITRVFSDEMKSEKAEPMVGIISLSLPTIIERINWCYECGIRYFQISLPSWGACTFDEIRLFFAETCGRFPNCSFIHYNCPYSKRLVTPGEYALISEEFSNLVATKNGAISVLDMMSLIQNTPDVQHFLTEFNFALAHLLGLDVGFLVSIASINWKTAKLFYNSCIEMKLDKINQFVLELKDIHKTLFKIIGTQGHINGVFDKMYSKIADNNFPLRLLPPYTYADDASFLAFQKYIKNNYPQWIEA